nr:T9SS type A sorting domain-containing protein [uncultured Psychroserpens sp.]
MKSKLLASLIVFLFTYFSNAQDLTMQDGSWTECDFILTDSGGATSNYGNNEDLTLTLCPQNDGDYVTINFLDFSTQFNEDFLAIYDGPTATGNSPLIGSFSGTESPGFIEANNASGCLTLRFISNGTGTTTGWSAEVQCNTGPFVINQPSDFLNCDDNGDGFTQFNLSFKDQEILGGLSPNNYSIFYYETQQDADNQTNPLPNVYTNITNPQIIYVNVIELSTGNLEQTTFNLLVDTAPQPNLLDIYEICDGSSILVDSGLNDSNYQYEWYFDGIILPNEFGPTLEVTQTGFYQLGVFTANGCNSFTGFEVILNDFSSITQPSPLVVCDDDDDGFAIFDLEDKISEITNGIDNPSLVVSFHETEADAFNNVNALSSPYNNVTQSFQTIYVNVSDQSGNCSTVVPMDLVVDVNCVTASSVNYSVCGESPNIPVIVDLTLNELEMVNDQNTANFTFEYYLTQADADAQTNPLTNPEIYEVSGNSSTIYVRVIENSTSNFTIVNIFVNFNLNPEISFNDFYAICSGQEVVLTPFVNGDSGGNLTYLWSNGQTDPEIVVFEGGDYSVTVTDTITGCSGFAEVFVDEGDTPVTFQPDNMISCVANGVFDLTSVYAQLLGGENPTNFNISFHLNTSDAFNQTNAIANPEQFTTTISPLTIFVTVQNISNSCISIELFDIISEDCPIEVNCGEDAINTTYCYELDSADEYTYTSTNGAPIQVVFNAGQVEDTWDELTVVDSDGTVIYSGYGNSGDLTGLTFSSSGDTLTIFVDSDGVFACADQNYIPIDYDVSCVDLTALPNCTSLLTTPQDGDVDINENIDLTWTAASGFVGGYKLSVGITPNGTEVLNAQDVGNVLTYDIGTLDYETTYYVTIVAYNINGDATGCTEQSFTTRTNPNQTVVCDEGAINTTYCYDNNDTTSFSFQSENGDPLTIFFNAGSTEVNFDTITILDSNGNVMNPNLPYGNSGDFTGLSYTSSGDTITVVFDSDGSISCAAGSNCCTEQFDFDVYCSTAIGIIDVSAFVDVNTNTIFDASEPNFSNGYFTYEKNNDGNVNTINSSTGSFQIVSTEETDVYEITFNLYEESEGCYDITTSTFNNVSVLNGASVALDFAVVEEQSCEDLSVSLINYWTPPRPGFSHDNYIVLENLGFTTITSGTVEFIADPQLIFNSVTGVNSNYTVNTTATGFTLDFVNLQPGAVEYIDISLTCPATVALGDIVTNTANYLTNSNDLVASNNYSTLSELVVGSWDPNDKRESHGPRVDYQTFSSSDEWLYYTIRFQNLGTFAAEFVRIEDALNNQLDATTFQMLRASHDYVVTRTDADLEWFFEDINLPAEQDDVDGSQGFVYFRIKPNPGYAIGDIIPNTASIFFDFNAPVITNRFDTEFVEENLSVDAQDFVSFDMFPNPANDVITIRLNENHSGNIYITIVDLQGKNIIEAQISEENIIELDIKDLQSGLYFVKLSTSNKNSVKKLIIE